MENCVLIAIVVAAFLAMQGYLRRTIQGNWRANTDVFSDEQYDDNLSSETVSALTFVSPQMSANLNMDESIEQTFNLGSSSGIIRINGWGRYE